MCKIWHKRFMFVRQKKQNTVSVFCTVFNALPPQSSVDDVKIWARVFVLFNKTRLLIKVLFALINGRIKHKLFSDPVWLSLYTPYHFTSFHGNKGFVDLSSLLWQVPFLTLLLRPYGSHQLGPPSAPALSHLSTADQRALPCLQPHSCCTCQTSFSVPVLLL